MEASLWFKIEVPIVGLDIIDIDPIPYGSPTLVYFSIGMQLSAKYRPALNW